MEQSSELRLGAGPLTAIYVALGLGWIFFSDLLLALVVDDARVLSAIQSAKGFAFVALTGAALYLIVRRDVHVLRTAKRELVDANAELARMAQFLRANPNPVVELNRDGRILFANDAATNAVGKMGGPEVANLLPESVATLARECLGSGQRIEAVATTGEDCRLRWSFFPVAETGSVYGFASDLSAEMKLEAQLFHSQKMEGVGRLASGVAHDFNNLLTAVMGYADLGAADAGPESPMGDTFLEIRKAAERGSSLTRQLLALGRPQAHEGEARVVEVDSAVRDFEKLLHRVIGADVALEIALAADGCAVMIDQGQLEQVILNLVVNARDAMPNGGRLWLETEPTVVEETRNSVAAGAYTVLRVRDEGVGMDAATLARIYEPFFTTKAPGTGTGLGLPTSYGIVTRAGGAIEVQSEVGRGTTFSVYLPTVELAADPASHRETGPSDGGTETILIAEDESLIRDLVTRVLEASGYRVLVATESASAMRIAEEYRGPIDLLLSDIVMPGMNGPELARRVRAMRPACPVLLMSGYPEGLRIGHEGDPLDQPLLQKPFTRTELLKTVRDAINGSRAAS
ncbi:MAG: ATP-binding protein [Tepidiformaceae bacterium]